MKNFNSIKKNEDFKIVYDNKKSFSDTLLVMYIYNNLEMERDRIGISVSKKVGNSVVRHKVKRRLREIFRLNEKKLKKNFDIVVVCRKEIKDATYDKINESFIKLCKKHKILEEHN